MGLSRRDVLKGGAGAQVQAGARYDLLLKGGEFLDPGSGRRGQFDVAFAGDKVAAIGPGIDPGLAKQVESAAGAMVVPGVIDMHVHAADGIELPGPQICDRRQQDPRPRHAEPFQHGPDRHEGGGVDPQELGGCRRTHRGRQE